MCKICFKCKKEKDLKCFSKNPQKLDGLNSQCKTCHSLYRKEHYQKNKQKYIDKAVVNSKRFDEWFENLKSSFICKVCGESRHWVLDFHHRDPNEKELEVSILRAKGNKKRVLLEIEKCDVLCANCHRDLHYQQKKDNILLKAFLNK